MRFMLRLPTPTARLFLPLLAAVFLVGGTGCASSGEGGSSRNPDLITRDEVTASSTRNAYDLVQQIRPNWLRGRGTGTLQAAGSDLPNVYVENQRHGDLESLRGFDTEGIESLRFINAANATTRFGSGNAGGVIQITLRR